MDLEKKLAVWEHFYNNDRPHGAHRGKTPYEMLREKLRSRSTSRASRKITPCNLRDRVTDSYFGTKNFSIGLRLAIVQHIVGAHGGTLSIQNGTAAVPG